LEAVLSQYDHVLAGARVAHEAHGRQAGCFNLPLMNRNSE
jgi:hypothetical protein